jgi:peptidoglycan/LPS O-acetylase OafA/YrhL
MHYIRNLDGVRGLAITLVMVFHYNYILEFGWVGVQLFFVLSGFLITSILLKNKEQSAGSYFGGFYWRRSLRIFPIYYFYLLVIFASYLLLHTPLDFVAKAPWLFTYTYNLYPLVGGFSFDIFFTHLWSLCIEEQFYLLWPLVIFFFSKRQLKTVLILFIFCVPIIRFFFGQYLINIGTPHDFVGQIIYRFTFSQWDSFAFGAAIPVFTLRERIKNPQKYLSLGLLLLLVVGIINLISLRAQNVPVQISSLGFSIGIIENYQHIWSYSLLGIVAMLLILASLQSNKILDSLLGNPVSVFIGKISYGLYVYHWVIWMTFNKFVHDLSPTIQVFCFIAFLFICVGVSYLSYLFIERPLLAMKDRTKRN